VEHNIFLFMISLGLVLAFIVFLLYFENNEELFERYVGKYLDRFIDKLKNHNNKIDNSKEQK
jgi:hypothetical protein